LRRRTCTSLGTAPLLRVALCVRSPPQRRVKMLARMSTFSSSFSHSHARDDATKSTKPPKLQMIDMDPSTLSEFDRWRCFLWLLLDDPSSGRSAKYMSAFVMLTIMLSIVSMTFASIPTNIHWRDVWSSNITGELIVGSLENETYPNSFRSYGPRRVCDKLDESRSPYGQIEIFCIAVFTSEYLLRAISSPAAMGYFRYFVGPANVVDLISIMPFYIELVLDQVGLDGGNLGVLAILRLIRLTRITRIFKMSKNLKGLQVLVITFRKSAAALLMLFLFMLIFSILFATLMYTVEGGTYDVLRRQYVRPDGSASPFESIGVTMWWTIVTMCTVGYGDEYPVTPLGKILTILTMFSGLIVLSLPITIIGKTFDLEYKELIMAERQEAKEAKEEKRRAAGLEGGDAEAEAIQLIHELIDESHETLREDVFNAMISRENQLRREVKRVLKEHNAHIGEAPLERMTSLETAMREITKSRMRQRQNSVRSKHLSTPGQAARTMCSEIASEIASHAPVTTAIAEALAHEVSADAHLAAAKLGKHVGKSGKAVNVVARPFADASDATNKVANSVAAGVAAADQALVDMFSEDSTTVRGILEKAVMI